MVEAGIDGNTVEPGVKGSSGGVIFETLICLYEGVLCGILGILRVLQHIAAQVVNPVLVFLDKPIKR